MKKKDLVMVLWTYVVQTYIFKRMGLTHSGVHELLFSLFYHIIQIFHCFT